MIVDNIENLMKYEGVLPHAKAANDFILNYLANPLPLGTYEIDGDNCYAFVQEYEPENENDKHFESHQKYIDLQFVLQGKEKMIWSTLDKVTVVTPFKDGSDCAFYDGTQGCPLVIDANEFAIFFPHDAHKPGCLFQDFTQVKKLVVKIKIG